MKNILIAFSMLAVLQIIAPGQINAQSASWHELEAEGEAQERHENALVRAGNKIILLGGRGLKAVDIYDTQDQEWTQGAQPPLEVHHVQAVSLDGLVYVVGAFTGSWPHETPLSHILIYDPLQDTWAIGPEIPENRRRGAAGVVVYQDKIYVVNGIINGHTSGWVNWLDEFDPASNKWRTLPNAPRARDHVHVAVIDDKLYVAGGRRSGYSEDGFANTIKETNVFDFNSQQWMELSSPEGDIPTERAGSAAVVYQSNLLVMGGESGEQELAHNEVEMLDVASGSWETLPPMQTGRHGTQAISFGDMVVIGAGSGNRGGGPELNSFEVLAQNGNAEFPSDSITQGEISASVESVVFNNPKKGNKKRIEIKHRKGNQAILLQYIQLDNTTGFELQMPLETPFILAPGQSLPIEILYNGKPVEKPVTMLVKTLGNSAPLSIPVVTQK